MTTPNKETLLAYDGITQPITEWALDYGITSDTILERLRLQWPVGMAITLPMIVPDGYRLPKSITDKASTVHELNAGSPIECRGTNLTLGQWAAQLGTKVETLKRRLCKGMSIEAALTKSASRYQTYTHNGKALTLRQWVAETGVSYSALRQRLGKGWSINRTLSTPERNRGIVFNLPESQGTGGGRSEQETPN